MTTEQHFPVIDLFAGPGGLGEGFASLLTDDGSDYVFRTALSIEKDEVAHRTLELRHFFRCFSPGHAPDEYYHYLEGRIMRDDLLAIFPEQAAHVRQTAWKAILGQEPDEIVKERINQALHGQTHRWALVGGPPCQAYSRIGRSRMMHLPGFEQDERHHLYKEYLRILADHAPPVFVMENVPGILSSKVDNEPIFPRILSDLHDPVQAVYGRTDQTGYTLYSLSVTGAQMLNDDPAAFVVRAEDYGIPQARHRVLIMGIRNDVHFVPDTLIKSDTVVTVHDVIGDMPRLRSRFSSGGDSAERWVAHLNAILDQSWFAAGRNNGRAEIAARAEEILLALSDNGLRTSDRTYPEVNPALSWLKDDRLHVMLSHDTRSHMDSDLHRYFYAAVHSQIRGVSPKLKDFPADLLPAHTNITDNRPDPGFADRFRVQLANKPATTVTSHIHKDGHYYIHYDPAQCRSLTVREAARLQTFPDNYKFEGNRTQQYQQVGNAVPPLLARQIARIVYAVLKAIPR